MGLEGSSRRFLATPTDPPPVGEVPPRVLGPLDPLVWDRDLVRVVFGFEYLWEVYKPAGQRRWGYYVCPVVAGDGFVGRVEAQRAGEDLVVTGVWGDPPGAVLEVALARIGKANRCARITFPSGSQTIELR